MEGWDGMDGWVAEREGFTFHNFCPSLFSPIYTAKRTPELPFWPERIYIYVCFDFWIFQNTQSRPSSPSILRSISYFALRREGAYWAGMGISTCT